MGISLSSQILTFLYAVLLGAIFGIIFDMFRLFRVFTKGNVFAVAAEDILFFVICAFLCYVFMLVFTHGTVRMYVFIASAAGFLIYYRTVGRLTLFLFSTFHKRIHPSKHRKI